jgi:hypothetical protein
MVAHFFIQVTYSLKIVCSARVTRRATGDQLAEALERDFSKW